MGLFWVNLEQRAIWGHLRSFWIHFEFIFGRGPSEGILGNVGSFLFNESVNESINESINHQSKKQSEIQSMKQSSLNPRMTF